MTDALNSVFRSYATRVAFNVSLSRNMVLALTCIAQRDKTPVWNVFRKLGIHDSSLVAGNALLKRGLVHAPDPKWPGALELTRAGELMVELLREAGIVEPTAKRKKTNV